MPEQQQRTCDILVRNGCVLTMDASRTIISDGAIAICGHSIAAVGSEREIARDWRSDNVIDAKGAIVHPGYVDAHLHVNAQTCRGFFRGDASRGSATGPNYADWKAALTGDDEYAAAGLAGVEMLRHGITTFVEPGSAFDPDAVAAATQEVGIRCTLAEPYLWDTTEIMDASFRASQARPCLRACRRTAIAVSNCSAASCSATATRTASCTATSRSMAKALRRTSFIAAPRRWRIAKA